jgi:hypothetical protein
VIISAEEQRSGIQKYIPSFLAWGLLISTYIFYE